MKNFSYLKRWGAIKLPIFFLLLLWCPIGAQAQEVTVSGTVSDAQGALPGVGVLVQGTTKGTITNEQGYYQLTAEKGQVLQFSYLGYATQEMLVGPATVYNVVLQASSTALEEVTVNAGYYTVKDKERTGSIARITAKDIEKQPVTNVLATMQGRMAGVSVTQATGMPGGGFSIQIRGLNSIRTGGNDPLYIVDGMPYGSQSLGSASTSISILPTGVSPLNHINIADIESIEVLKDADATAIYGSRGANGVVLITTKRGKSGHTRFGLHASNTIGRISSRMDLMNTEQYLAMRREAFVNDGITTYPANAYDVNGRWDQNRYTDWIKELLGGTSYSNHVKASVSGGSVSTQFMISGNYLRESTVFPGDSNYRKGGVHSSIVHQSIDDRLKLTFSVDYTSDKNNLPGIDLTRLAYTLAPNAPSLYDEAGALNWENGTFRNPLAYLNGAYLGATENLNGSVQLTYRLIDRLVFKSGIGYNNISLTESRISPTTLYSPFDNVSPAFSMLYLNNGKRHSWIFEPQLAWDKEQGEFDFTILTGLTFQDQRSQVLSQTGTGFASNALINTIDAASSVDITAHDRLQYRYNAIFGRANIKWKDRYLVNITGRRDGSSRFGPSNRFAAFGAFGAAWLFSEEPAIKGWKALSSGKLRASYGTTGNDQIGDYQYLDTYTVSGVNYGGITGLQPSRLFNPSFGWERNKKIEASLEVGFFQDDLVVTTSVYQNRSSNQLVGIPLPGTTGFTSLQANLDATVQNTGLELDVRTVNMNTKNLKWTSNLNLTLPRNKLIAFSNLEGSTYANSLVIGESLNILKVYNYEGIDPTTGLYTFKDLNGDGVITAAGDKQWVSDVSPKFFGGFGNQLDFKNWKLDFLFHFVKQQGRNYIYTNTLAGTMNNQPTAVLNHFPNNGTAAETQHYTTGANSAALTAYSRYTSSTAAISDASFVRLKSINLTYTLPSAWSKTFTGKLYIQGQNLLTITQYKGADPENQSTTFLPPLKQFTFGVDLNF
jgi:TonB-linked SusC/RagA family outer membrane protein